jgi:hypothetical protein
VLRLVQSHLILSAGLQLLDDLYTNGTELARWPIRVLIVITGAVRQIFL